MQEFIESKYSLSPFLAKFLDAFALFNRESILQLKNSIFRKSINKYFQTNLALFKDFDDYLGLDKFSALDMDIFEMMKPGDALLLNTIVDDIAKIDVLPREKKAKKVISKTGQALK